MKRLLVILGMIVFVCNQTFATTFSQVCSTGQTLYYETTGTNTVRVIPSHGYTSSYQGRHLYPSGMAPSGYLEIPSQVLHQWDGWYTVTEIGNYAFYCCDSLETVLVPSTVTSIGQYAFSRCDTLSIISFGNVTSIGACAFSYCRNLSSIWLPNGITEINESTFNTCSSLQFINIPNTVCEIKGYAFQGCINLQSVVIPSNVIEIWPMAFGNCTNLSFVTFSEGSRLTYLFPSVFSSCTSLHDICLPDSLSYVGGSSFENCTNLHKVTIGQSVTSIGPYTFRGCINLDTIIVKPISAPSLGVSTFDSTPDNKVIIVPCSSNYCAIWGTDGFNYTYNREHVLTVHPNNPNRGHVCVIQERGCDTTIVQAIAAENCVFLQWNDGDTTNPRTIITTSDASYTAFFEKQFNVVLVETNDSTMGTATGSGTYAAGNVVNLIAAPKSGYFFDSWNDGNTDNPRTIIPVDDTTIIAIFSDIHDTVLIHDTIVVNIQIHDTTTLNVHDTMYINVPYAVHDTTIITDTMTLTEYVPIHDTTFINVHDTTYIDEPYAVHDTTIITDTLTLTEYVPVHDTTVITDTVTLTEYVPVHDTTIITDTVTLTEYVPVHDTTVVTDTVTLMEYVPVHDTTYINVPVHDTTYITQTDTMTVTEYVPVHDTTYITQIDTVTQTEYVLVHDTTIVTDTVTLTQYDTITNTLYDTLTVTDTLWLTQTDTLWLHDTIIIYDTVYITEEGVYGVAALNAKVYSSQGQIVVEGAEGNTVTLYDVNGRILATKQDSHIPVRFDAPASGTYMIKIGDYPARKVVVIR